MKLRTLLKATAIELGSYLLFFAVLAVVIYVATTWPWVVLGLLVLGANVAFVLDRARTMRAEEERRKRDGLSD